MTGLSADARSELVTSSREIYGVADMLDTWARRHAPDPESQACAEQDAADLYAAAALLRIVGERQAPPGPPS